MPPKLLTDLEALDLEHVAYDLNAIRETVPQRFEMEQLTAIHHLDRENKIAVGSRQIGHDEWWARGHIPGRPIFPGVLTIEAAAQLATWLHQAVSDDRKFFGLGGVTDVRFRGAVGPGDRLILISKVREIRSRKGLFDCQGALNGKLVFEALIIGMPV
jgi:3-hydroxyacyl-[acyl-carrier-protein] dehydratase